MNMIPVSVAHEKGIEVEPGDELDFPIYYRAEDEAEARAQDEQWGDLLKMKTYRRSFGRIAAQTAKQVMIQGTRNAERENVFNEYKDRKARSSPASCGGSSAVTSSSTSAAPRRCCRCASRSPARATGPATGSRRT